MGVGSNPTSDTFFCSLLILIQNDKRTVRQRGIEPRSTAWKATMLTITPLTPLAFMGHKTRTNVIQILLTKAHHLSVLSFTVVMYCHFNSFAYWCNGKNILMTTKFYWHRSKCVIKEYSRLSCSIDCYNMNQKSFQLRKIYHFLLLWRLNLKQTWERRNDWIQSAVHLLFLFITHKSFAFY